MRPVATLNENEEVTAWHVELRVSPDYGRALQNDTPLDLLIEGGPDVAPSIRGPRGR